MLRATLATATKFLCCCRPDTSSCPYCLGLPGALALPNRAAVDAAADAARALGLALAQEVSFLRALDPQAPRGYRMATTSFSAEGADIAVWLEEGPNGTAEICAEGPLSPVALDEALKSCEILASPAREAGPSGAASHPAPDQPSILL